MVGQPRFQHPAKGGFFLPLAKKIQKAENRLKMFQVIGRECGGFAVGRATTASLLCPQVLVLSRTRDMSKLIKAITDMMENYQGNARKGKKTESFSRSEFKKLIQQEFAPVKVTLWD